MTAQSAKQVHATSVEPEDLSKQASGDFSLSTEILAVHAALLRSGEVLYFSGSQHDQENNVARAVDATRLWDPETERVTRVASPAHDLFCCGHAFLGDGRLLVAGGTKVYNKTPHPLHVHHLRGLRDTVIFDPGFAPGSSPWHAAAPMSYERGTMQGGGRWYPTLLTLGDGRVFVMSGHPEETDSRHNNTTLEVYNPTTNTWADMGDNPDAPDSYPRLHLLPTGDVFCSTSMSGAVQKWSPSTQGWTTVAPAPGAGYDEGFHWTSVLLPLIPPNYRTRVLLAGQAVSRILDLGDGGSATGVSWADTGARVLPAVAGRHAANANRRHCLGILLPDGKVLMIGGSPDDRDAHAVLLAEIYDPETNAWSTEGSIAIPRVYHGVALLLPDGRVWVAGSNYNSQRGEENRELRWEIYAPPYLAAASRPSLTSAPASVGYGEAFTAQSPEAASISRMALIRCPSVTHGFDSDQRYIQLQFTASKSSLNATAPSSPSVAPPGYYLLYAVNSAGVPSVGRFVRIS